MCGLRRGRYVVGDVNDLRLVVMDILTKLYRKNI